MTHKNNSTDMLVATGLKKQELSLLCEFFTVRTMLYFLLIDIQKRFQRLNIHNTNKPSSHEHHDHHKRSLLEDKDDSFSTRKQHYDPLDPILDNIDPRYMSKEGHSRYHSSSYNHDHTSSTNHDHSFSDSSENSHNHYNGHSHDRPSEYNHVSNHEHSHAQQIHGHQNDCPRLVPALRGNRRDHFGELKDYDNWVKQNFLVCVCVCVCGCVCVCVCVFH